MRKFSPFHDLGAEQVWIRDLVRRGRVHDPEGCFKQFG